MPEKMRQGAGFVAGGAATGTWVSLSIGGMRLSFSGTAVGLGLTPLAAAGAVTGAATYGAFRAIVGGDASAINAVAIGGLGGASVSMSVGGMGLSFSGTAVSLGLAPITSAGMVVGLAVYGVLKIFDGKGSKESSQQIFSRMEETIGWNESYQQALLDLNLESLENMLLGDKVERQFLA